jgi:hypothetical protein
MSQAVQYKQRCAWLQMNMGNGCASSSQASPGYPLRPGPPAPAEELAYLPVEALSNGLMGGHDLFGMAATPQGFGFQLKDQFIAVAEEWTSV